MKNIFEVIGLISLACFSFFYTSQISSVIKNNDDIYKQIKDLKEQYLINPINAIIDGNTIIPGLSGSEIDVNNSYKKMKQINSFNDNLLVYKNIKPYVSVNGMYDKYIISGNTKNKKVALLFLVKGNDKVDDVLYILDEYEINATFYIDGYWFDNNNDYILKIIEYGHNIGNLGYANNYNNSGFNWMNSIVKNFGKQVNTYCYNEIEDLNSLEICKNSKSYTIRPSILIKNNPLIEIKQNLKSGSIISLDINEITIKQLPLIIDYINSRDLEMVNLDSLIEE